MILDWFRYNSHYDQFEQLTKYLLWGVGLILAARFLPMGNLLASIFSIFVVVATPYLLFLLWKIERRGWFWFLVVPTGLLLLMSQFSFQNDITAYIVSAAPLVFLFIYIWMLLIASRQWKEDHDFGRGKDVLKDRSTGKF